MAKVLCMEIGVSMTKIVEMDYMAKKPRIYQCIELKTPENAVRDGYLNPAKIQALKEVIKGALAEKKIRTRRVIFTVFSGKIISREILLPSVKPSQIKTVIETNISGYFPIELDDYKIAHYLIRTIREGENAGKHKVLVMAVEKMLLSTYERFAAELGLRLMDIDYAGHSVVQATRHSAGAGAVMVVKAEEENAMITILHQGTFILQRNVNLMLGMSIAEISQEEIVESLVSTMMRVADFYISHNESNRIEQIYIIGENSRDTKMVDMVAKHMQIPCKALDAVKGVVVHKNASDASMNIFAAAIGAGISSVGFANKKEKEHYETNYFSASMLLIGFFVLVFIALWAFATIPYNIALMEEEMLHTKVETYASAREVYEQYENMAKLYLHMEYGHILTEHSNDAILSFLDELERKLPAEVEMTEFSSNDEMCVMTMRVSDKETAAGIINDLRAFSSIKSVCVEHIIEEKEQTQEEGESITRVLFTISCYYNVVQPIDPAKSQAVMPES